jgi:dTDP-4-amino-4,6-dideoxygalactose transaminase
MTPQPALPFNRVIPLGREQEYVTESLLSGHMAASGAFATRATDLLSEELGGAPVMLTTSCTAALEMAALMLDLQPGDEVIVPSFTFSTTALAFAREGARILFCDIERDTLGLDPDHVAALLEQAAREGRRVRAVVPVHYAGVGCQMERLAEVLADHPGVSVVEDNAHGLFGSIGDRQLGTLGRFATQSFHETKNFSCGEGGALVVNDPADLDRARILYDKGTNRRAFMLGQVDKYTWVDTGSSFGMADPLAAFLLGQLEQRRGVQSRRRELFEAYGERLAPYAEEFGLGLPVVPPGRESAYHMFHVLLPDRGARDAVLSAMNQDGVRAVFHYIPLHSSVAGRHFSAAPVECPVSDEVSGRLLRLPFFTSLTDEELERSVASFVRALETVGSAV